jgi:hypothetical protein
VPELFGEWVLLVRTPFDGDPVAVWLPAAVAVALCRFDPDNGETWASARIVADDCDMGAWDRSQ